MPSTKTLVHIEWQLPDLSEACERGAHASFCIGPAAVAQASEYAVMHSVKLCAHMRAGGLALMKPALMRHALYSS